MRRIENPSLPKQWLSSTENSRTVYDRGYCPVQVWSNRSCWSMSRRNGLGWEGEKTGPRRCDEKEDGVVDDGVDAFGSTQCAGEATGTGERK